MIASEEYTPFLSWNPEVPIAIDSVARVFLSLVSMVRDGYKFDEELECTASQFLSSVHLTFDRSFLFGDELLMAIEQDSSDPAAVGTLHQPTLNFVCSSHIPTAFQTLLSKVENEDTNQYIIWMMFENISTWKKNGAETMHRGRILLQTQEGEGFRNHLDQALLHDKASTNGKFVGYFSFAIMKDLGMNSPQPQ
ncbi:hypothetical protein BLNAU_15858 [Blattamonas nauphoetae]|uniref:Uncharacterized protein n=1 Tax=Blattamonas nauphoetae TaxID=2049346 RepID=A0ABQ9XGG3_9EUKA|nr:hypothetical protein BLNAU_15858 [Blattamonas nauphoetae]